MEYYVYINPAGVAVPEGLSKDEKRKIAANFKANAKKVYLTPNSLNGRESRKPSLIQISPTHLCLRIPGSMSEAAHHYREGTPLSNRRGFQWNIPIDSSGTKLLYDRTGGQRLMVGLLVPRLQGRRLPFGG